MDIKKAIKEKLHEAIEDIFDLKVDVSQIIIQKTKKEFSGDFTIVVFPLTKLLKKSPEELGELIGEALLKSVKEIKSYNVIKGFLNIELNNDFWLDFFIEQHSDVYYGYKEPKPGDPVVIEFSSPNTNKPLHLGHIRNNLLGDSISRIIDATGRSIKKVNLVNDRGIHICKTMLAWQKWGKNKTPYSTEKKGDKFVGDFYILFEKEYKKEVSELIEKGQSKDEATKNATLILEAKEMLKKWESSDPETIRTWEMMNDWVYRGFEKTYNKLGISFDKTYYESDTYLLGKKIVEQGLKDGVFYRDENGSVWVDLSGEKLDNKLLLRSDGTSVYMTQDIGTAELRYKDFNPSELMYVVGNEQNYHFDVLKIVLKKLNKPYSKKINHLSYGMVELPEGKMKSREGTVVDADDLMQLMVKTAEEITKELGKIDEITEDQKEDLYNKVGIGALKYFILKVDPKKNMLFNPKESIDFNGNTAPFILYTYARIHSVLRKAPKDMLLPIKGKYDNLEINSKEKELLRMLFDYPEVIEESAAELNPAHIANYTYELAKEFNQFYHENQILNAGNKDIIDFRIRLASFTGIVIRSAMNLLGINVVDRM